MAMYQAILREFTKQGLSETSQITESSIKQILDSIALKNASLHEFDPDVAHEIWEESGGIGGTVILRDYIDVLVKAECILKTQVDKIQEEIRVEEDHTRKQDLMSDLFSYSQDHRTITLPFNLEQIRDSKEIQESRYFRQSQIGKSNTSQQNVNENREESNDLKIVLALTLSIFILEMIAIFHKNHFFTLIGIFLIVNAFILNFFDRTYIKIMLAWIGTSAILNLVWLILEAPEYWSSSAETQHSTLQVGFLRFIVFIVGLEIIGLMGVFFFLFKYKDNPENSEKKVTLFGMTFTLHGTLNRDNLVVKQFLNGGHFENALVQ